MGGTRTYGHTESMARNSFALVSALRWLVPDSGTRRVKSPVHAADKATTDHGEAR
jgi:hypothetical protein